MDIFVGSLSFKLKESELREVFEKYGEVSSAKIIIDKITRQSKGFGFVEMPDEVAAKTAIRELNGVEMHGRPLVVNESQKRETTTREEKPKSAPVRNYGKDKAPGGGYGDRRGFNKSSKSDFEKGFKRGGESKRGGNKSSRGYNDDEW
jgi:RNA recognition motif-containing protein